MKKIGLVLGIGLFCISLVFAGIYILQTFNFTFTVEEPLSIEYYWNEYPSDCYNNQTPHSSFTGNIDPGRIIYPGNHEIICFKITSLSNGNIPLYVDYNKGEGVGSYSLDFPSEVSPGINYGGVDITIAPEADGIYFGNITFGRGSN